MRIVLVRHGKAKNDRLTSLGKHQVKILIKQLKKFNFNQVICSSKQRCVQTAQIISKSLNLPLIKEQRLEERYQLEHLPQTTEEHLWWDNYLNIEFSSTLPDDCASFLKRNFEVFNEQIEQSNNKDVLIIAHSATSYALLNYITKQKTVSWQEIGFANYVCYEVN